jgi:hypothetical protein
MATDDNPSGDPKSKFAVVQGAAPGRSEIDATRHGTSHRFLVSISTQHQSHPMQLSLPGIHEPSTGIVSLSFTHFVDVGFSTVIQRWIPTYVVDIRVAPTFVPIANRTSEFTRMLAGNGISYIHKLEISNRFSGDAWHPELLKDRFVRQLRESVHLLEKISSWALTGRVLVISADPQTQGSDREIFAEEIRRISASINWHEIS